MGITVCAYREGAMRTDDMRVTEALHQPVWNAEVVVGVGCMPIKETPRLRRISPTSSDAPCVSGIEVHIRYLRHPLPRVMQVAYLLVR